VSQAQARRACDRDDGAFDPGAPITTGSRGVELASLDTRLAQRMRRSQLLATIRRHLTERGFDGVTVRGVADACGCAVQTFYNLVGPRDAAIVEAISEYTRFVGRTARIDPSDPAALPKLIDSWLRSIDDEPEFCRQVSLIFFTGSRDIYYGFRDGQQRRLMRLLAEQRRCGVVRPGVDVGDLARELVLLSSALCLEWSDRPYPLGELHRRLRSGFDGLLAGKLTDRARLRLEQLALAG
jgi:AcrR family transcriptional regulator